jgi:hypothetical protein
VSRGWLFPLRLAFVLLLVLQAALPYRPALPAPETLADSDAELISTAAPPAAANLDLNLDLNLNLDLFTGQRLEQRLGVAEGGLDRGLYFYGARCCDSSLGRFIQADTIVPQPGNPQALNRYVAFSMVARFEQLQLDGEIGLDLTASLPAEQLRDERIHSTEQQVCPASVEEFTDPAPQTLLSLLRKRQRIHNRQVIQLTGLHLERVAAIGAADPM